MARGTPRLCLVERFVSERNSGRKEGTEQAQIMVYVSILEKVLDQIFEM